MICENCGSSKQSKIFETRERKRFTMRRRRCIVCGYEYWTHEVFIRGEMPVNGLRVLSLNELKNWTEAVWLETEQGIVATSIKEVSDTAVLFGNDYKHWTFMYNHSWRVWNSRPSEKMRLEKKWE